MFKGSPVTIEGFQIPYDGILFLIVLSIHVAAGLTCVLSGIFAMLSEKRKGIHTKAGTVYYYGIWIVFATAVFIAVVRWKEDHVLFILGAASFLTAFSGRMAVKRKINAWPIYHISGMGLSYIFLLIAFYVDNGRFLPVWKNLNPMVYWLLPLVVGIPIILITLLRHPLSRNYFQRTH
jgi:hypothetical protein